MKIAMVTGARGQGDWYLSSPYGVAKLFAHQMIGMYRQRHGMFACSPILFNHESPRRGRDYVTARITRAAASIKLVLSVELPLGNPDARRGFADEYVRARQGNLVAAGR